MLHTISFWIALLQFLFYVVLSSIVQYRYYYSQRDNLESWKCQPKKLRSLTNQTNPSAGQSWLECWSYPTKWLFFPSLPNHPNSHPYQPLITTFNLWMSCCWAGFVAEQILRGHSQILHYNNFFPTTTISSFKSLTSTTDSYSLLTLLFCCLLSIIWQCVCEYYWHRLQHLPWFYGHFHKLHHFYQSPQPFDDLMIHPVEAFGYYCILYSPAFLIPQPLLSFLLYMTVMGLCGVLDHCGVVLTIPYLYDTREHDAHHQLFNVNYSFPFPFMDQLHGTFHQPITNNHKQNSE